jgi:peroxiredoxin
VTGIEIVLVIALAASWALLGFQSWLLYLLVRQHGKALLAQDELRARMTATESDLQSMRTDSPAHSAAPPQPQHLSLGTRAPEFRLPDLNGVSKSLADFQGQRLLVVFFNPECGFCQQLAPELGRLPKSSPRVVLVSRGDVALHVRLAQQHAWRCDVLLEPAWEVATAWGTNATPTGYLVDAQGRIASTLAVGAPGLLDLVRAVGGDGNGSNGAHPAELTAVTLRENKLAVEDRARAAGLAVTESRIAREGLKAGTPAPDFRLPDLKGRRRALADYRGRRVLLVFSDPGCGPCQDLTPRLQDLRRAHTGNALEVLMVGRGDPDANRAKAREFGVTFPVVLQRQWEVSRQYAIFATPVGYLIDPAGVIEKDVAIGAEAILGLAAPTTS